MPSAKIKANYHNQFNTSSFLPFGDIDYNDFDDAEELTDGDCSPVKAYTTVNATPDQIAPPIHPNGNPIANRWFKMQVPASGDVDIAVICNSTLWGEMTKPVLGLWNDDLSLLLDESLSDPINNVNTYVSASGLAENDWVYLSVDVEDAGDVGEFSICVNPGFDEPSFALEIPMNGCLDDQYYAQGSLTQSPNEDTECYGGTNRAPEQWYKFVAPANGIAKIVLDNDNLRQPNMSLWDQNGTLELGCINQDQGASGQYIIQSDGLTPEKEYLVSVSRWEPGLWNSNNGPFDMCVDGSPNNDFIDYPSNIDDAIDGFMSGGVEFNLCGSTATAGIGSTCWNNNYGDRWFEFTAPEGGINRIVADRFGNSNLVLQLTLIRKLTMEQETCSAAFDLTLSTQDLLIPGEEYLLGVSHAYASCGTFGIRMYTYDQYDGAYNFNPLLSGGSGCSSNEQFSTVDATPNNSSGGCGNATPVQNRWFKFTATTNQIRAVVQKDGNTTGSQKNTNMALWSNSTNLLKCATQTGAETDDVVLNYVGLNPGTIYYISVDIQAESDKGTLQCV